MSGVLVERQSVRLVFAELSSRLSGSLATQALCAPPWALTAPHLVLRKGCSVLPGESTVGP